MIDLTKLSEAARRANTLAEEYGIEEWARLQDVDLNALVYMADQRATRSAALLVDGQDKHDFEIAEAHAVRLSRRAQVLMPVLIACVIDGLSIGLTLRKMEADAEKASTE